MKTEYLLDFIKDEEKEEFKRKQMIESKSKKQFTLTETRKQFLEIAKELTNEINRLEDLYKDGQIDFEDYVKKRDVLMELRVKNRKIYLRENQGFL